MFVVPEQCERGETSSFRPPPSLELLPCVQHHRGDFPYPHIPNLCCLRAVARDDISTVSRAGRSHPHERCVLKRVCVNSLSVQYGQLYSLECKGPRSEKENRRPLTSPLTWLGSTFARSSCSDPPEKQPLEGSRDSPVPLSPSAAGPVTHLCAASCYPGHGTHLRLHEERCETAS